MKTKSKSPKKKKAKIEMCKCGKNPASEPHTCPYAEDIAGNYEDLCTCCDDCTRNCIDDI